MGNSHSSSPVSGSLVQPDEHRQESKPKRARQAKRKRATGSNRAPNVVDHKQQRSGKLEHSGGSRVNSGKGPKTRQAANSSNSELPAKRINEKLEPLANLIGGNVATVKRVQQKQQKLAKAESSSSRTTNADDGALPSLVVKPLSGARGGDVLVADDDCDEIRAPVSVAKAPIGATIAGKGSATDESWLKFDSQQAQEFLPVLDDELGAEVRGARKTTSASSTNQATTTTRSTSNEKAPNNQIRDNGRGKCLALGGQKVVSSAGSKAAAAVASSTSRSGGRQPLNTSDAREAAILKRSSSVMPANPLGSVTGGSSGASMRALMMLGSSKPIKQQQGVLPLLQQRLNLVEDHKQKVRKWLDSQPFTEQQTLEVEKERWTSGEEGQLTMPETITNKTNEDADKIDQEQQQDQDKQLAPNEEEQNIEALGAGQSATIPSAKGRRLMTGGSGSLEAEDRIETVGSSISGSIASRLTISLISRNDVFNRISDDEDDRNNNDNDECNEGGDNRSSKRERAANGKQNLSQMVEETGTQRLTTMTVGLGEVNFSEGNSKQEVNQHAGICGGGGSGGGDSVGPPSSMGETVAPDIDDIVDEQCSGGGGSLEAAGSSSSTTDELAGGMEERKELVSGKESANVTDARFMQMIEFKKHQATVSEDCSLCLYLESLKAVANGPDRGKGRGGEAGGQVSTGACKHQPNKGPRRDTNILSVVEASIWSDIKLDRHKLEYSPELKADGLVVGAVEAEYNYDQDDNATVADDDDQANDNNNETEKSHDVDSSEENRPFSAHSRLCPLEGVEELRQKLDETYSQQQQQSIQGKEPSEVDHDQEEMEDEEEDDEVPSTEPPLPPSQVRRIFGKSAVQRGLSLDANNSNNNGKQQLSGFKRRQLMKMNSKQGLSSRRHMSQSSKLIVISSNSVSYTIQVASEDSLTYDDLVNQKNYITSTIHNRSTDSTRLDKERAGINCATKDNRGLVDLKYINKRDGEFMPLNRIDSCKKFLVKKISSPNARTARIKRKQVNPKQNYHHGIHTPPPLERAPTRGGQDSANPIHLHSDVAQSTPEQQTSDCLANNNAMNAHETNSDNPLDHQEGDLTPRADAQERALSPESSANELRRDLTSRGTKPTASRRIAIESEGPRMKFEGPGANESQCSADETDRTCNIAAKRLRELVAHLEHGSVPQSVLYQTLEYAASVLDSVTMDQISRVSDEEDGDLSEVQSDAVPNEVRIWLETTFTRNSISQKRKSEDKLKFRSVANVIRAGIVVDRIYRRMSASTPFVSAEVSNLLKNIDDWSFDCFSVNQVSNGQVLKSVGYELFNRYGLMYKFKIPTTVLKNFLTQIESGYVKHKNPYHNNLHAADVTQTVHYMLWQAGLTNWLTDLEIFATLLAAIIHDYLHTGTTNNFHVMSQSDTALIYNDRAVLENFHICQAFTLMRNEDCNILAGLSKDEYREFRSLVIDMVLATDMSSHFQQIKAMKNILNHSDNFNADKSKILSLVIHISDISHPAKEWELHSNWTQFLMEEFFRQGDREKELNLECSPLCDRETTLVAESQLGFIEFIVSPSLEVCGDVLDRVLYQMAEADARPVLPASAKAASVVAASTGNLQQAAIEAPPKEEEQIIQQQQQLRNTNNQMGDKKPAEDRCSSATSPSSIATSFVSSETLTSNLRKMIVSSSATIGRKLNISGGNSSNTSTGSPASSAPQPSGKQPLPPAPAGSGRPASQPEPTAVVASDFELRQANYKHPVIRCDSSSRPKSSGARVVRQQRSSDIRSERDDNSRGDGPLLVGGDSTELATTDPGKQQLNRLKQPSSEGGPNKRNISSALATCGQASRSVQQQPQQPNKIQRPWIKCLDRNKKMWQERAVKDAQARELKERLKQQQQLIESAEATLKQVEERQQQQSTS